MVERRAEQNSLATCPVLTGWPWQALSRGPSAKRVYHVPHRACNSCDSVRSDLQRLQSGSVAALLACGSATLFSNECLAAQSVFGEKKKIPFPQEIQTQRSKSKKPDMHRGRLKHSHAQGAL